MQGVKPSSYESPYTRDRGIIYAVAVMLHWSRDPVACIILIYRASMHTYVYLDYSSVPIIIDIVRRLCSACWKISWNSTCPTRYILIDGTNERIKRVHTGVEDEIKPLLILQKVIL